MFWKRRSKNSGDLDGVADLLIVASRATDAETELAASSSDLYARIWSSIDRQSAAERNSWTGTLKAARLAIPALALLSLIAATVPGLLRDKSELTARSDEPALIYQDPIGIGACAISTAQECAVSNNDVLAALFVENNQEVEK
jgi:hypothetical protein